MWKINENPRQTICKSGMFPWQLVYQKVPYTNDSCDKLQFRLMLGSLKWSLYPLHCMLGKDDNNDNDDDNNNNNKNKNKNKKNKKQEQE